MKITKVINNNVVSSIDENGNEIVVMGRGIAFQKKVEDEIDEDRIQKVFTLNQDTSNMFEELIKGMPYENILLAEKIIALASSKLNRNLNKGIYITLTDHLNYAIERSKQGLHFENALLWEIKKFYTSEYQIGLDALELVKEDLGIELAQDEAGFIALHIVNAQIDGDMRESVTMPKMIKDILNIVRLTFDVTLDDTTLSYERFVTHIKFFLHRMIKGESYDVGDEKFNEMIEQTYFKEYNCALRIQNYVQKNTGHEVSNEELIYLTTHINRILRSSIK